MIVGNLVAKFDLDAKGFTAGMIKVQNITKNVSSRLQASLPEIKSYALRITAIGAAAGYTTLKLARMFSNIEGIERKLAASVGGIKEVERAWSFLGNTANRLGLSLEDLASNYGSLAAAAQSTNLTTKDLENIFTALSEKAAILGMSADRVRLTFLAIEQMASKTVISMEELRRQFGENVPGALGIMARSLGISVKVLNKWVTSGKLLAEDVLPLMANQMLKENIPALDKLQNSTQVALGKMNTAWFNLKQTLKDSVIRDAIIDIINATKWALQVGSDFLSFINKFRSKVEIYREKIGVMGVTSEQLDNTITSIAAAGETILMAEKDVADKRLEISKKINEEDLKNTKTILNEKSKLFLETSESILGDFTSFVSDLAIGADVSFVDMLNNMAKQLLDFTTTILVVRPIMLWLENWLTNITGVGGGFFASLFGGGSSNIKAFARGGMINEPVFGIGANSNSSYLLGEKGPEAVIPADILGNGNGEATKNVNITINALDSKSVTELLRNNPQAVTTPLVEALSNGDRGLSSSLRMAVN